jgi:glucokinase
MLGAVDIGGTKIAVGAIRDDGTIVTQCECPTDPARGFPHAIELIKQMLHSISPEGSKFKGIGIACPGPLDPDTGIIGDVGTLPGWQGGNLTAELEHEFGVTVAVENDADAAALAEAKWGTSKNHQSFIYVTVSTGIGGGIIFSGQLYRGVGGAHPELGHQVLDSAGPLCYCGSRGCWESLASGSAMVSWMREHYPNDSASSASEICQRARMSDPAALCVLERQGYYLGLGLANLVTLFTPDVISLGGGLMKSSSLFLENVLAVVRKTCTQVPVEKTRIVLASLGQDAALLGAAQTWLCRYGQRP